MTKPTVRIKDWYITGGRLFGVAINHPQLPHDGDVMTSPLVSVDLPNNTVETMNTIYKLENPHATINKTPA